MEKTRCFYALPFFGVTPFFYFDVISQNTKGGNRVKDLNYTPLWRKCSRALGATHLCSLTVSRHGSKRRERPGERAPRYAFACLSAPRSLCEHDAAVANLSLSAKKQKGSRPNGQLSFWRRRRDLNSRAGIADLHP